MGKTRRLVIDKRSAPGESVGIRVAGGNLLGIFVREILPGSPAAEAVAEPPGEKEKEEEEGEEARLNVGDQVRG